ncbi:unnamed protein product [Rotaria sp. Silwood2]|nr:unnamed protein product [Rotaria sp. Silwood2]
MSIHMQTPIASDALHKKAQECGVEQAVKVNQRMLIDKMLARYSSDFVVCRELIQNADDAQATFFHFEITCVIPMIASEVQSFSDKSSPLNESLPLSNSGLNYHNSTITEIRLANNGTIFNQTDWERVASIAEGNTNVDSVGQFGVGFFSVFSLSQEPIITSGNEYMVFVWRDDNSLTTFRHQLPIEQQSKLTAVILKMRSQYILKTETNLDIDVTTMKNKDGEYNIKSVKKKRKENVTMKEIVPAIDLTQLKTYFTKVLSFTKYINEILIKINGCTIFQVSKTMKIVPSIRSTLPFKNTPSMSNMLIFNSFIQTEQTFSIANASSLTLNHVSVNAQVTIGEEFHYQIQRIMKKSLPSNVRIQLLFAPDNLIASQQSQSSSVFSDLNTRILNSLIPLKFQDENIIPSGLVFIGLGTHQTSGIGMHVHSHLIPTIERENVDLQDPYIAKWKKELLSSIGQIIRLIYDQEMIINADKTQLTVDNYDIILSSYSFQPSVPNNEIDIVVPVKNKPSDDYLTLVHSSKAFLANSNQIQTFLTLPLIPFQLTSNGLFITLAIRGLLDYADKSMVEKILMASVLSIPQFIALVNWLFSNDVADEVYAKRILSIVCFHNPSDSRGYLFRIIKYYDALKIPLLLSLPTNVLSRDISALLSIEQLERQLSLSPVKFKDLFDFYFHNHQLSMFQDPEISPQLLSFLSRYSGQFTETEWTTMKTVLYTVPCIPTTKGMKMSCESFVPSALVSPKLPVIVLNIPQANPDNNDEHLNENIENPVSIYFLKRIGCRMLSIDIFDNDQDVSMQSQSMEIFIQKLIKERKNMSETDFNELKQKKSLRELHDLERQVPELRKKADDERAKKEAAVNKLQEIVTNPMQHNPFYSRPTGGSRRHDRDRNERNVVRRLEQALTVERMKYTKLQNEKDDEVATLLEDINKLKRELEIRRDEIEKFKQQLESRTSNDNISSIAEEVDDDSKDYLESWVQTPKKSNIQKYGWKKQLAVLKKNRLLLYNSEKDQQAVISIDIE